MIKGIGTDIIEIKRIHQAIKKHSFLHKIFTETELCYFYEKGHQTQTLAAFFAAKEAFSKAIGTGFRGFSPKDIEILHDNNGKPFFHFSSKLESILKTVSFWPIQCHISLSHCKEYAIAFVVLETYNP